MLTTFMAAVPWTRELNENRFVHLPLTGAAVFSFTMYNTPFSCIIISLQVHVVSRQT